MTETRSNYITLGSAKPHPQRRDHPEWDPAYQPMVGLAICDFRGDLCANGQQRPIHVLPAPNAAELPGHTILDGHLRVQELGAIGYHYIDAIIRYDLADLSDEQIRRRRIRLNYEERSDKPGLRALLINRLIRCEYNVVSTVDLLTDPASDVINLLQEVLGRPPAEIHQYAVLASAMGPIAWAVDEGHLSVDLATSIISLPDYDRDLIEKIKARTKPLLEQQLNDMRVRGVARPRGEPGSGPGAHAAQLTWRELGYCW